MEGVLSAQFCKTGDTPFILRSLRAPAFPAVLIPPVQLKEIRREFYRWLAAEALGEIKQQSREHRETARAALLGSRPPKGTRRSEERDSLAVKLEHLRDYHLLHQEGIDSIILPVSKANMHQLPLFTRKLKGREQQIIWQLPFIIFEADIPFYREAVALLIHYGFRRFEAANLSHFELLKGLDVELSTDYRLFSLNSQALLSWQELGATAATLYIEDDADNMAALMSADLPIRRRVIVYSGIPAITSKIRIKDVRSDVPVQSDRGEGYRVTSKDGLTVITPTVMFSLTAHKGKLKDLGVASFIVDLSASPQNEWGGVLDACRRGYALPGTSEFNFTMGLV
jgi:putative protease